MYHKWKWLKKRRGLYIRIPSQWALYWGGLPPISLNKSPFEQFTSQIEKQLPDDWHCRLSSCHSLRATRQTRCGFENDAETDPPSSTSIACGSLQPPIAAYGPKIRETMDACPPLCSPFFCTYAPWKCVFFFHSRFLFNKWINLNYGWTCGQPCHAQPNHSYSSPALSKQFWFFHAYSMRG